MALTFTKKQFLHMLIFSSGVGILMWQIKGTFLAFIDGRTTFAISKENFHSMILPTIVFCPVLEWDNGMINIPTVLNLADKDWFFGQFFLPYRTNFYVAGSLLRLRAVKNKKKSNSDVVFISHRMAYTDCQKCIQAVHT